MTTTTFEFDVRVEARQAFAERRRYLLDSWLIATDRTYWAQRIEKCNDAELAILGSIY